MNLRRVLVAGAALALCLSVSAQEPKDNPAAKPVKSFNMKRHEQFLKVVAKGEADVIFIGDSITQGWEGAGKKVWAEHFAPLKAVNLGIGGEQTTHVLWRITEGKELDPIKPKVAVIMIGTNNMGGKHTPEQKPEMKILVLAIFPRSAKADDAIRKKVNETNTHIAKIADDKNVFYKDIGPKFLDKDGTLDKKIMPDLLHLSPAGYTIWAEAIKDDVMKLMK
jgi:lysophospholipase L1-like esterase